MVTVERLQMVGRGEQKKLVSYSAWLDKVAPDKRKFNLDQAFNGHRELLNKVFDPEDRAYLSAIGEARIARMEGDPRLLELFPKDFSRTQRLAAQLEVVHWATPVKDWQKNTQVRLGSFVVNGEVKIGELDWEENCI